MMIENYPIKCILVDIGSSIDVLLYDAFVHMNFPMQTMRLSPAPLVSFNGEIIEVEGEVTLLVTTETPLQMKMVFITFTMVNIPSAYNVILGCPRLNQLDMVVSTKGLLVWFPTKFDVCKMKGDL